ncbi:MAG: aspartate ammonia-lyase [Candidatus Bathyarchaeia archaeon]
MKKPTRLERDALGSREVPVEAYYGLQTLRAVENFPISGLRLPEKFIEAYAVVKKVAALANRDAGVLAREKAKAVVKAADEVLAGKLRDQFIVDVYQMGAGTSFNMNMNEVLANRAIELLGGVRGDYGLVNPYDDVNRTQSTNDTFPTAMRIAALWMLNDLEPVLDELVKALHAKAEEFDSIVKAARTHLQDAVPIRLGQELAAYALTIAKCRASIMHAADSLRGLGIGGNAAGTGVNTPEGFTGNAVRYLSDFTGLKLHAAEDLREAMQSLRPFAEVSASLRNLALEVTRISNDLRLMSSGPTSGLGEIQLPPVAPGSSIMPGKVNPSILEMVNMVCFQAIGNDATIAVAVQAGQFELNVMMPVVIFNLLFSIQILTNALRQLRTRCVEGVKANVDRCQRYAEHTVALATALNTYIGYAAATEIVMEARRSGKTIQQVAREKKVLPEDVLRKLLDPRRLTGR